MQEPSWPPGRGHDRQRGHRARWRDRHAYRELAQAERVLTHGQGWHDRVGHGRRDRGPLGREPRDRLGGGIAAGFARWRGMNPTTVRIIFVIVALFSQGAVIPIYFIAWLVIPPRPDDDPPVEAAGPGAPAAPQPGSSGAWRLAVPPQPPAERPASIVSKALHDSRGIALAVAVASLLAVVMLIAGLLNDGVIQTYGWPQVISAACLVLIWRNATEPEQATLRRLVAPLGSLGADGGRRGAVIRIALALALLATGVGWLLSTHQSLGQLQPLGGFFLIMGAIVLLLGPWWLRVARDLVIERQARARAEERADMAARIHDSVLQTLALIQRRADDPAQVTQLARAQERELRSWLFEGRAPGSMTEVASIAEGIRKIQQDVEARHGVPVEVVTVGDCPLDDDLSALLEAAREAVVNAAKWSQAPVVSLYAEVTGDGVEVVARDRGAGFDPSAVPGDRKGMAESIQGRMTRHGGTVTVHTGIGEGTKVSLKMARRAVGSTGPGAPAPGGAAPGARA
ncbi:MAG TPA: PspC domain-containing protein [Trebonia sp.]|jgi:signal transduction histidine kinase/phage shock protein PspC (stress-responsive transcriptional regulator)|nr:PspC domain-containing protein [Trebonia sp.]